MGETLTPVAYILGTLFNYLVQKDQAMESHRAHMSKLNSFMQSNQLPANLCRQINRHFEFQFQKVRAVGAGAGGGGGGGGGSESKLHLPRALELKVAKETVRSTLDSCTRRGEMFFRCNMRFLDDMAVCMKELYAMPGEGLSRVDDISRRLLFVVQGSVQAGVRPRPTSHVQRIPHVPHVPHVPRTRFIPSTKEAPV